MKGDSTHCIQEGQEPIPSLKKKKKKKKKKKNAFIRSCHLDPEAHIKT